MLSQKRKDEKANRQRSRRKGYRRTLARWYINNIDRLNVGMLTGSHENNMDLVIVLFYVLFTGPKRGCFSLLP